MGWGDAKMEEKKGTGAAIWYISNGSGWCSFSLSQGGKVTPP